MSLASDLLDQYIQRTNSSLVSDGAVFSKKQLVYYIKDWDKFRSRLSPAFRDLIESAKKIDGEDSHLFLIFKDKPYRIISGRRNMWFQILAVLSGRAKFSSFLNMTHCAGYAVDIIPASGYDPAEAKFYKTSSLYKSLTAVGISSGADYGESWDPYHFYITNFSTKSYFFQWLAIVVCVPAVVLVLLRVLKRRK